MSSVNLVIISFRHLEFLKLLPHRGGMNGTWVVAFHLLFGAVDVWALS